MRKSLFISLVCFFLFPLAFVSPAKALDIYQLDQSQTLGGGSVVVYSEYNRNQTFKVTKGILTRIDVLMKNRQGGFSVTLTVKDETNGTTIATKTQRMGDGDGWETFDLSGEEYGIAVDKSHTFSMWIGTSYFPTPAPSWEYENSNVYANGTMRNGTTPSNGDYAFKTYGWELIAILPPKDEEVDLPEDNGEDEEPGDKDKGKGDEVILTPDTSSSLFSFDEDDVDDTVIVPALEFVIVNNIVVDSQKEGGVVTGEEDIVKITGTAGANNTVAITIGDKTYTTTADKDGNWYIVVSMLDLEPGSYTVKAQSQNKDKKVSTEVELFKLNVGEESTTANEEEKTSGSNIFTYIIYGASGLFLIGLIILVIFLVKRKNKGLKKNVLEIKTPGVVTEEPKEVIKEEEPKKDNI